MTVSTRAKHMDLIFDLTNADVETLKKALDILENIADEIGTVADKEKNFTDISIVERRQFGEWYSLIERIIVISMDINTLLEEPIFDNNPILTEKRIDD